MFTRMLQAQPRHVVAKLNGLSSAEECDVLRSVGPSTVNDRGEQCYSVAAVRLKAESYRHQATLGTVLETAGRTEAIVQEVMDKQRRHEGLLVGMGEQISRVEQNDKQVTASIALLCKAMSNGSNKGKGLTPAQVGNAAGGWSPHRVRDYARKGLFPKSLLLHRKNKRYAFDPNKVMEDIADIKKRPGTRVKKRLGTGHKKP